MQSKLPSDIILMGIGREVIITQTSPENKLKRHYIALTHDNDKSHNPLQQYLVTLRTRADGECNMYMLGQWYYVHHLDLARFFPDI